MCRIADHDSQRLYASHRRATCIMKPASPVAHGSARPHDIRFEAQGTKRKKGLTTACLTWSRGCSRLCRQPGAGGVGHVGPLVLGGRQYRPQKHLHSAPQRDWALRQQLQYPYVGEPQGQFRRTQYTRILNGSTSSDHRNFPIEFLIYKYKKASGLPSYCARTTLEARSRRTASQSSSNARNCMRFKYVFSDLCAFAGVR